MFIGWVLMSLQQVRLGLVRFGYVILVTQLEFFIFHWTGGPGSVLESFDAEMDRRSCVVCVVETEGRY